MPSACFMKVNSFLHQTQLFDAHSPVLPSLSLSELLLIKLGPGFWNVIMIRNVKPKRRSPTRGAAVSNILTFLQLHLQQNIPKE